MGNGEVGDGDGSEGELEEGREPFQRGEGSRPLTEEELDILQKWDEEDELEELWRKS